MPSLFLVCFGTTVFVCLLFSAQFYFEAKATGKYKQTNKEIHAMWGLSPIKPLFWGMLLPVWDSWLVSAATPVLSVVGGHEGRYYSLPAS